MHNWFRKPLIYLLLIVIAALFLTPVVVMLATSLKANEMQILHDRATINAFWADHPSFENYISVISGKGLGATPWAQFLFNTILVVGSIVGLGIFVNSMAAFALSRLHFVGRGFLVSVVVALMIIPFEGLAVPLLLIINRFGWFDTYHVQIVPFIAHPFSIFLFYQFFTKVPKEFDEAARVDGASWWQVYRRVILPLSLPVIATVAILQALEYWNSFLWPMMVTRGPDYRPLSVAMNTFFGQPPRHWGDVMAFAALTSLPLLFLYLLFQRWFIQSVAKSGLKG